MAGVQQVGDLVGDLGYDSRSSGLRIQNLDGIRSGIAPQQTERQDHRLSYDLGLAKGRDSFFKDPYNRESQFTHPNLLSNRISTGKNDTRQVFGQKAHLAAGFEITGI